MSYKKCLELAGAEVIVFQYFGSYQGDWWAKVRYNGQMGWVNGSFGSCSACDAFEFEFGDYGHTGIDGDWHSCFFLYDDCEQCRQLKDRMAQFGRSYLEDVLSQEEAERYAAKNLDWDFEAKEMLKFIQENTIS